MHHFCLHEKPWVLTITIALLLSVSGSALGNEELVQMQDDPEQWVMPNGNYSGWNYSPLDQIDADNVDQLTMQWTFQSGVLDSHEAQPLVIGDTMYVVTPKPNWVYALDLTQNGVVKWSYQPEMPDMELAIERACCGAQTRGLQYADGKIFYNTLDGQVIALDAETGEELWNAQNTDLSISEVMSAHPLIVNDNVIVGVMGGEFGVRGHITAYDVDSGERQWRMYSTGPNEDVGIGERFQPFYADDQIENPAEDSWFGDSWERGGGTVWGWFTYDPELNTFYYSTGNCAPWNPDYRREFGEVALDDQGGLEAYRNNYCASILARDGDTGELLWAYNLTPQDQWDLDEPGVNMLIDLEIDGEMRHTLVKPARNGMFYVFDRETGEILNEPFAFVDNDLITGVDLETGRTLYNPDKMMFTDGEPVSWCPGISARNWHNDAYSPETGLVYTPANNQCRTMIVIEEDYVPGEPWRLREYVGEPVYGIDGEGPMGMLIAFDPVANEIAWQVDFESAENDKPVLATAGNLLFQGSDFSEFRAYNAETGEQVWAFRTGSDFQNSPISYVGPDGRQYIAVLASSRGQIQEVGPEDPPDATGRYQRPSATLYVFALPEARAGADNN